jgi:hypothetical protein
MLFPQTQEQLYEMAAMQPLMSGVHRADMPDTGRYGLVMGETVFDPLIDSVGDIRPDSIKARITGAPHVQVVMPRENMNVNLVVDADSGQEDHWKISQQKQKMALGLAESVWDSTPSSTDWFGVYYLGEGASKELQHVGTPIKVENVADLCLGGITMIMSDFRRLHFDRKLPGTIGIKVNHPADLSIPPNVGVIPLGNGIDVNTNKKRELQELNDTLRARRESILRRLADAGLSTVEVVYRPSKASGFDVAKADAEIANKLKAYAKN